MLRHGKRADATFIGDTDKDSTGNWHFSHRQLAGTWPLFRNGAKGKPDFYGRFTLLHHVGVFPEQVAHWKFMEEWIITSPKKISLLNLFGHTGIASLIVAREGACASKKAVGWARQNQKLVKLQDKPIRWICNDAIKFCEHEVHRSNFHDAIILDPPKFGHGRKGELWQLFRNFSYMTELCRKLLSSNPLFVILTSCSIDASFYDMHTIMRNTFGNCGGELQSGELIMRVKNSKRALSTSLFSRWIR